MAETGESDLATSGAAADRSFDADPERGGALVCDTHNWVEIELIDEQGKPLAGERYVVRATDRSEREGQLDENGRARVEEIEPGYCEVGFPGLVPPPTEGSTGSAA